MALTCSNRISHSVLARFTVSLIANMLRAGISFLTGLLLARWLGPEVFGRMAFLLASFMAFKQLLDMASSSAFFTFLSQRPRSRRFVSLYLRWVGIQFLFSLALVSLLLPDDVVQGIWKGETRLLVVLALVASFMQGVVWPIAAQMAEANRETLRVQRLNTLVVLIHLMVVLALWTIGQLVLPLLFAAMALEWALAGWLAAKMYHSHLKQAADVGDDADTPASVWCEFWQYCLPFIPYAWLGFAHDFADRWMLQHWGGATEQAYYAVAQQFVAVALLATSSILRIFWKEIAEAHHAGDRQRVERLYLRVSRVLYFVGAAVAGGLLPWAEEILQITVGSAYANAAVTLMLMFLYPVHQSMGVIGSTMLYATGHVRTQVVLGIAFMATSLIAAYFMMAPANAPIPGLGLASQGLAWKMVLMQLVQVNIMAWLIARIFGWKFEWIYQPVGLTSCVVLGWLVHAAASPLMAGVVPVVGQMIVSGILYAGLVLALLMLLPWLAGFSRNQFAVAWKQWK